MLPPLRRAPCRPLRPRARRPARLLAALLLLAALRGGGTALPPGCKYDGRPKSSGKAAAGGPLEVKVVCSNLELAHVLPPEALPNRTVTLFPLDSEKLLSGHFRAFSRLNSPSSPSLSS